MTQTKKLNLLTHCGANKITLQDLSTYETPPGTRTHVTIPHDEFFGMVQERVVTMNLRVVQSVHAVTPDAGMYFGMMQVVNGADEGEFSTVIGCRNSHNKRFPASIVCGSGVFVCDNLIFSGEVKVGHRHTLNIRRELPSLIESALERVVDVRESQNKRLNAYHGHMLTDNDVNRLLIESYDRKIISSAKIGQVIGEYREPTYEYATDDCDVWALFNAFTHVMKPREIGQDLFNLPSKGIKLHKMFDKHVGYGRYGR